MSQLFKTLFKTNCNIQSKIAKNGFNKKSSENKIVLRKRL
jgi:hypothetical protein